MEYTALNDGRRVNVNCGYATSFHSHRNPPGSTPGIESEHNTNETEVPLNEEQCSIKHRFGSSPHTCRRLNMSILDGLVHIFRISVPMALLVLLIATTTLQGQPATDEEFAWWDTGISVTASLFPMLFAFVMGHAIYEVARTKLEKGTALSTLEQLIGSRTLGGAIMTPFGLSTFNLLGLALLAIWCLSPLGSQALLRILSITLRPVLTNTTSVYQDVRCYTPLSEWEGHTPQAIGFYNVRFSNFAGRYGSVLQVPSDMQSDSMDIWGNVRIPFLDEDDPDEEDRDGWQNITWANDPSRFSSLAGLPISSLPEGNNTLHLESSYIHLDCFNMTRHDLGDHDPTSITPIEVLGSILTGPDPAYLDNSTWIGVPRNETRAGNPRTLFFWEMALDRFVDPIWWDNGRNSVPTSPGKFSWNSSDLENWTPHPAFGTCNNSPDLFIKEQGIRAEPTNLFFRAILSDGSMVQGAELTAYCRVTQRYVESRVECRQEGEARRNCTTVAQRPSRRERNPPEDITYLSFPTVFRQVARQLPLATEKSAGQSDLAVQWLNHSSIKPATSIHGGTQTFGEENIDLKTFSTRLAQVLNTYITLSTYAMNLAGEDALDPNKTVIAQNSVLETVYHLDKRWITVAFACCSFLLLSCIASLFLAYRAKSPEVLGFASSSIRDSKLIDLPRGLGTVEGLEISKQYGKMRVRYGYSDLTLEGRRLVGIGREEETALMLDEAPEGGRGWLRNDKTIR